MLTYWEILTGIQSNVPVNDIYAQLWGRKTQGGYTVVTYIGTLPAVLTGTKAGYLHRYKIYGNTEQTGSPTPENPIEPQECGERTENSLNFTDLMAAPEGTIGSTTFPHVLVVTLKPNTTYSLCSNGYGSEYGDSDTNRSLYFNGTNYPDCVFADHPVSKTTPVTGELAIGFMSQRTNAQQYINNTAQIWLIEGSTTLPYEPYGYKLPLTSESTLVDIYIGDDTLSTEEYVDSDTGKIYRRPNLYNINATDTSKGYLSESYLYGNTIGSNPNWFVSEYMPISANTDYVASGLIDVGTSGVIATINIYDNNKQLERYKTIDSSGDTEINSGVNGAFIRISARNEHKNTVVVKTKNAVPTDPPLPFPQIPTSAGSTTISWAGEGLAPSHVELEYEKKR